MKFNSVKALFKSINKTVAINTKKNLGTLSRLIISRSKKYHKYSNRTGKLTRNLKSTINKDSISFYTEDYGFYVVDHYDENWVKNASDYYFKKGNWR